MEEDAVRVGVPRSGLPTEEQSAAFAWIDDHYEAEWIRPGSGPGPDRYDLVWWHSAAPAETSDEFADAGSEPLTETLEDYVREGGRLLVSRRGMVAIDALDFDPIAPDDVGTETVSEPTGALWKAIHDDHRAVAGFDGLRVPIVDGGTVPYARYRDVLPENGEILAATVEGGEDRPRKTGVVSWHPGEGVVAGVGLPLCFATPPEAGIRANRDTFLAGLVDGLLAGPDRRYARPDDGADFGLRRRRLREDEHRPRYHVGPPGAWLNDPNGLLRWNDRYHVFYQYNPAGPFHDTIHWGHAVSDDLVRWRDEPIALAPSVDGPDRDGCWSGCAVTTGEGPAVLYTGGREDEHAQLPCLATADDPHLRSWTKHDGNPIIDEPPDDVELVETDDWRPEFRDHCVWREGDRWYHLVGSGIEGVGGTALLYTGDRLDEWTYEGPILTGDAEDTGSMWECPELLRFEERDLLHVSNGDDVYYFLGDFDEMTGSFDVESRGTLDPGDFYAPQSMRDGDRYLTWGWLPEARNGAAQWEAGWSGMLSLPRVLDVTDGDLRQRPAPELTALRGRRHLDGASLSVSAGSRRVLDTGGRTLELALTIALEDADEASLSVFESPNREEVTDVRYARDGTVRIDRSASSLDPRAKSDTRSMAVPSDDGPLSLRVFLDGSSIEVFANDRRCLTSRVYPTRTESTGVSLAAEGGTATVTDLSAWHLESAWPAVED